MQTTIINLIVSYVREMFARFAIKSPAFFKRIQVAAGILVLITESPKFLAWFSVHVPSLFGIDGNTIVGGISTGALFVALLTTQSKPAAVKENTGEVLKITDNTKLPFTAQSESKAADKIDIPVVAVVDIQPKTQ